MADERTKAIDLAFAQIEKQFGKGSIMRLGSKEIVPIAVIPTGAISFDAALGVGGFPAAGSSKSSGRNLPVKPPSRCRSSLKPRRPAAWPHLSMPNTRSIPATPRNLAWTWTTCWSPSPTTANRH